MIFCCCCCTSNIDLAIRRTKVVLFIFITLSLIATISSIVDASIRLNQLYAINSANSSTTTTTSSPIYQYLIRDERTLIIGIVLLVLIDLIGVIGIVGALKDNFWLVVVYEVGTSVVWMSTMISLFLFLSLSFSVPGCLISAGYLGRLYKRQNKSKENKLTDSAQGSSETPTTGSSRSSNTQSPTTTSTATRPTEITLTTSPTTSQLTTPTTPSIQVTQESISQMISNYLESVTRSCNLSPREPPPAYDDVVLHGYVSRQPFHVNSEQINVDPKALQHQISDIENQSLPTHSHQDIHSQLEAHQPPFYKY